MSDISETVQVLESRIGKLFQKLESLGNQAADLNRELEQARKTMERQKAEMETLRAEHDSLKIASSLLGSDENKRDTKLKINSLIREIDYCIAQLSD